MYTPTQRPRRFISILALLMTACALLIFLGGQGTSALAQEAGSAKAPQSVVTATGTPCGTWSAVQTPDGGSYLNALYGVASISANDTWAVGEQYDSGLSSYMGMIEHWNGTNWAVVPILRYAISLRAATAISTNDVWAVGWGGGYGFSPITEHWNGSQWTDFWPNISGARKLYGVSAVSTNDVWAVGQSSTGVFITHWDGTRWNASAAPAIPSGVLYGVTAISANDVWAVGTSNNAQTVTLHWDGTQWSRITSPNTGAYINVLTSVSAISSGDVWAVGYWATSGVEYHGYTLHWDGTQWNAAPNPTIANRPTTRPDDPIPAGTYLYGVSAAANGDVWAVGRNLQTAGATGVTIYLENGTWTAVPSANPGYANTNLYGVAASSGSSGTWAVGNFDISSYGYTEPFTERYDGGGCSTQTPVPPTVTVGGATATATVCSAGSDYVYTRTTGASIVPGTDDVGINCQFNCTANITLPFPFTLYDRTFTSAIVGSNGILGFVANGNGYQPACLPNSGFDYAIVPDWELMVYRYSGQPQTPGAGVFTSVTGEAPNRIFNIEWRARDQFNVSPINLEVRLYENSPTGRFDMVYASVNHHGGHAVVGVQRDTGSRYTQFSCLTQGRIEAGVQLTFVQGECGTPVPPTNTPTRTPTSPPTNTSIPTSTLPPGNTPTPSPTICGPTGNYAIEQSTGVAIVPGTTDTGIHCSECSSTISLPFPFTLYDRTFTTAKLTAKGTLGFIDVTEAYWSDCLPDQYSNYAIFPHWDDLDTSMTCGAGNCGIYTSVTGVAPNRIFNIEWRARYHNQWSTVNFEVRLYEGQNRFDLVYGRVTLEGYDATVGVQRDTGSRYTVFSCWGYNLPEGLQLAFTLPICENTPTVVPTNTAVAQTNTVVSATNTTVSSTNTSVPATNTSQPVTNTPGGATSTSVPTSTAIATSVVTATSCSVQFTDVPQGSTFYRYINCMACRGIISGYSDGSFRPGADVTRGQLAKIVSNAAGFSEVVSGQTFEDVAPASAFYPYIERMSMRGIISGYACGGPGEPCVSGKPYFRPSTNATRGQIAKIVAVSANLNAPVSEGMFEDVSAQSPFYTWIETLGEHGMISGYSCGGTGEPCISGKPYFRPANNATRGQVSKIVASAFFPDCYIPTRR